MRGVDVMQESLFTTVQLDRFVPKDHPLRALRELFNESLQRMNGLFEIIYADTGRASIAPEKLLRAQLLQVLYSIRSERNWLNNCTTTCCSAGLWDCRSTMQCGITPPSARTGIGYWNMK